VEVFEVGVAEEAFDGDAVFWVEDEALFEEVD
jgi:hypothetical protein